MLGQCYSVILTLFAQETDQFACTAITTVTLLPGDCLLQLPFIGPSYGIPPSTTWLPVTATTPSYSAVSVYLDMNQRTPKASHSVECSPRDVHSN